MMVLKVRVITCPECGTETPKPAEQIFPYTRFHCNICDHVWGGTGTRTPWDDKPDPHDEKYWIVSARMKGGEKEFLSIQFKADYDAWLSKLRFQVNKDVESFFKEINQLRKENKILMPKAEMWELAVEQANKKLDEHVDDEEPCVDVGEWVDTLRRELSTCSDKLEDVKKYLIELRDYEKNPNWHNLIVLLEWHDLHTNTLNECLNILGVKE